MRAFIENDTEHSLGVADNSLQIACADYTKATFQLAKGDGTLSSGELTLERSIDGYTFVAMPTPTTFSALGVQDTVDCTNIAFLRLRVSTTQASTSVFISTLLVDDTGADGGQ